ncbi:MAG: NAD-dependent epimerase/dehydratase family protein [Proteobacteria bacterium]|nr:NAD-dependent epimerase/dehydratase family protein [Pseudomonadota bacterium]MCH9711357.1 NAD-dependent epimerase/dehydratase family protein [Pseudomonadota bacterium]MCH9749338.1 NAD-dependent epimerase/dehydratase family protein [Pseudomonadota bacterium]
MNKVYLITGIAGFIGSHIAEELLKNPNNLVIGLDNFYSGYQKNIDIISSDNLVFYKGDIRDDNILTQIFYNHKVEYIFHEAAVASVQKSIDDPILSNEVNVRGTLKLLNFARLNGVKRMVFASSAAIYGDEPALPKNEQSIIQPISPYGYEKLMSEQYMDLYSQLFNLETINLRYFNIYGPRQDPSSEYSGVISIFEEKFSKNECPTIYGSGDQYRDFIHVKDIVKVNIGAMHQPYNSKNRLICCGTGIANSINNLFDIFCEKYNKNWAPVYADGRKGDIFGSISDNSRMLNLVDGKLTVFSDGILNLKI